MNDKNRLKTTVQPSLLFCADFPGPLAADEGRSSTPVDVTHTTSDPFPCSGTQASGYKDKLQSCQRSAVHSFQWGWGS